MTPDSLPTGDAPPTRGRAQGFQPQFEQAMAELRSALTDLFAAVNVDPSAPQAASRSLGINRNVAWKLSKVVLGEEAIQAWGHLPGRTGLEIVLHAFEEAGAADGAIAAVLSARARLDRVVEEHAGDARTFDLMLANSGVPGSGGPAREEDRKLAFRGQSAIHGVQARLRIAVQGVGPNRRDPSRVDLCTAGGLVGLRRLRADAHWPVLQTTRRGDAGLAPREEPLSGRPLEEGPLGEGAPPVLVEHSTSPLPPLHSEHRDGVHTHVLTDGPAGRSGELDLLFGTVLRGAGRLSATLAGEVGEHLCRLDTPVERVLFDLFVHRDLPFELPPRVALHGLIHGRMEFPFSAQTHYLLPGAPDPVELGDPPSVSTPWYPRHAELVDRVCAALGGPASDFRGFRVELVYPPVPVMVVQYHPLPVSE